MTHLPNTRTGLSLRKGLLCTTALIGVIAVAQPALGQDIESNGNIIWDQTSPVWFDNNTTNAADFDDGDSVRFDDAAPVVGGIITITEDVTPSAIIFDRTGWNIAGASATDNLNVAAGGLTIDANSVAHTGTISAVITGTGPIATNTTGNGLVILSGDNSAFAGALTVNGGPSRGSTEIDGNYGGTVTVDNSGELFATSGTITGLVTNTNGAIRADGATFTGGIQANAATGNSVQIRENTTVNGIGFVNNGSFSSVDASTTLNSTVTNQAGRFRNTGTVTGNVTISGSSSSIFENDLDGADSGTVNGTIGLTGGVLEAEGGVINGLVTNNNGRVNAGGATFETGILNQLGTTHIQADTAAPVTNAGGFVSISDGVTLTPTTTATPAGVFANNSGNTRNRGTVMGNATLGGGRLINEGNITGTVTIASGSLEAEVAAVGATTVDAGTLSGRVTNNGGTIEANGGSFGAGIQNNSGTVNINAATTITPPGGSVNAIDNVAGDVNILAGGTLTGNISQTGAGTITNTGTLTGGIAMTNGTLNANLDGVTPSTISGAVNVSGGAVNLNGGSFNGGLILSGTTTVALNANTIAAVTNNGVAALNLSGANGLTGDFEQANGATTSAIAITGDLDVTGGTFSLATSGSISGRADVSGTGILNLTGGTIGTVPNGQIGMTGGTVNVQANTSADVTLSNGQLTIDATRTLTGDVANNGAMGNTGSTNNNGIINGNVTISAGTFENDGNIAGTVQLTGGTLDADAGTISMLVTNGVGGSGGTIQMDGTNFAGGIVNNAGGTTNVNTLTTNTISNQGGQVTIAGTGTLQNTTSNVYTYTNTSGTTNNNGTITGNVAIVDGTFENDGAIGGTVGLTGGRLNADSGTITGLVTNNTGTVDMDGAVFAGGIFNDSGRVNVNADSATNIQNDGGLVTINATRTLTGTLTNTSGITTNNGTLTGNATMALGTINNNGNISGTVGITGGRLNANTGTITGLVTNNGGTVEANGTTFTAGIVNTSGRVNVNEDTTSNITSSDELVIDATKTLTGNVIQSAGSTDNNGTITGTVTITTGTFENDGNIGGTVAVNGGTLNADQGTITGLVTNAGGIIDADGTTFTAGIQNNAGTVNVNQNTTAGITNAGGVVNVDLNRTLTGNLTNTSGTADIKGTVAGNVTIAAGTVENDGDITGTVGLTGGTLNADQGTITGLVTNNGGIVDADGTTFTAGITNTTGTVNVNASTTSDITNAGGQVLIDAGQTLTGNVTNTTGDTDNSGIITGTATVDGGTFDQIAGADTQGLTTLNGGTLNAQGGAFSGGIATLGGTLNITAATTANIDNRGATISIPSGQTLTGSLTNTSGTAAVDGQVDALTVVSGTVTTSATSTVTGATSVTGGTLTAAGGAFNGGINGTGGSVDINGATTGNLTAAGSDVDIAAAGTVGGNITQSGGTVDNLGTVTGTTTVTAGAFTNSGTLTGAATVTGGTFDLAGGALTAGLTNDGGAVDVSGAASGDITNTSGTVNFTAGGDLTGNVTNAGTVLGNGGGLSGTLTSSGTVTVGTSGLTAGASTLQSGSTTTVTGGTLASNVTAQSGATVALDTGAVTGNLANAGQTSIDGTSSVSGNLSLTGSGRLDIDTGALTIGGTFDTEAATFTTLGNGTALTAATTNNAGTIRTSAGSRIGGVVNNTGTIDGTFGAPSAPTLDFDSSGPSLLAAARRAAGDRLTFTGLVNNAGTITATDTVDFAGGLNNTGTVDLTFNSGTDDVATIGGAGLSGNGTFLVDADLSGTVGTSDQIVMQPGAFVTGNVELQFSLAGSGGRQDDDLTVIDLASGDPGNFTVTASGLPDPSGVLLYTLARDTATGDVVVVDGLNPGIGALAGNIVLTQSLIGSVINRPSSPFVSGLAYEDENPCGVGAWTRTTGGFADSSGRITEAGSSARSFDGQIEASYSGFQLGGDYACFNGFYNGWDVALGGIAGINLGTSTQPVFALDLSQPSGLSGALTSTTTVDFTQTYAGAYVTAVNGPVALDLQYRVEQTDFTATNVGANGLPGLGLDGAEFSSSASTISGAVSYAYPLPETELTFVPTIGFAYTQVSTDQIAFENRGVVDIDDFTSQTVFAGGTLSRTQFGDDGVSAINQFVTATIYSDFADDPTSSFTPIDGSGIRSLSSENLSTYSEVSAGVNYVRILQPGELGSVKQVSASLRGDIRLSDQLESWGLTGQVRFQF